MSGWEVVVLTRVIAIMFVCAVACTPTASIPTFPVDGGASGDGVLDAPTAPPDAPPDAQADLPGLDLPSVLDAPVFDRPNTFDVSNDTSTAPDAAPTDSPSLVDRADANACGPAEVRCQSACVNTDRDPTNCGACGRRCDALAGVAGARVRCEAGHCVLTGACAVDRADCDRVTENGCEADLTQSPNCGTCGTACGSGTPLCAMVTADGGATRACSNGCSSMTPTRCGMSCANLMSDPANCGACGARCAPPNAVAGCAGGVCTVARCEGTSLNCDGNVANGCEVDGATSTEHCGGCGRACPAVANGRAVCAAGTCTAACNPGHHLCGGTCVADDRVESCGASCAPCVAPANATATCESGACGFRCNAGYHRCGSSCAPDDHPTACGPMCQDCTNQPRLRDGSWVCRNQQCTPQCNGGYHFCDGYCVLNNVVETCGSSCTPCPRPANGGATCDGNRCGFYCNTFFHACGDRCVSDMDPQTCGRSCTPCPVPPNGRATCNGAACGILCNAGFLLRDGVCVLAPARPIAPLSGDHVTSQRPRLRWIIDESDPQPVTVKLCRDRALTRNCVELAATTFEAMPTTNLAQGAWFWRVERGSGASLTTSATWEFFVGHRSGAQNLSWGPVADFNGDGYADAMVGAIGDDYVYVYQGSPTGAGPSASYLLPRLYEPSVAPAGDVNGDGFVDAILASGVDIHFGSPSGLSRTRDQRFTGLDWRGWGFGVAPAGDVNGDGYADVLVRGSYEVHVFFGGPAGLRSTRSIIAAPTGWTSFAESIRSFIGTDLDGDGYSDVIIAGSDNSSNILWVYRGSSFGIAGSPARMRFRGVTDHHFRLALAGDVNGDGYPDIIASITEPQLGAGIFLGGPTVPSGAAATIRYDYFEPAVSTAGDANGDGYDDVVIGGAFDAALFLSNGPGLSFSNAGSITGPSYFARDVSGGGDVNGDGFADFIVGCTDYARIYLGSRSGIGPVLPDFRTLLPEHGYGRSVSM